MNLNIYSKIHKNKFIQSCLLGLWGRASVVETSSANLGVVSFIIPASMGNACTCFLSSPSWIQFLFPGRVEDCDL